MPDYTLKSKRNSKTGDIAVIFTPQQAQALLRGITPIGTYVDLPMAMCKALVHALTVHVGGKGAE